LYRDIGHLEVLSSP